MYKGDIRLNDRDSIHPIKLFFINNYFKNKKQFLIFANYMPEQIKNK